MCGITGILGSDDHALLRKMCDSLVHRGPDSSGYYTDANVSLGIRRLSIIDLVSGDQPIFNEDGSVVTVFNGEIYNFVELRQRLKNLGHSFSTQTDTEVIVHAYEQWGDAFVNEMNGMFAFCLWDARRKRALLARDRLGEKPLYYSNSHGMLLFGSEIKSILQYDELVRAANRRVISDYLTLMYVPGENTMFEGIKELLPGQLLKFEDSRISLFEYWDIGFSKNTRSEDSYKLNIRDLLEDSTTMRLRSDVPVGVFLSGGIDSSTIAAIASRVRKPIETFTIGFQEEAFSEAKFAKETADFLGSNHHEKIVEADAFTLLPKVLSGFDEPFGNPTIVISYLVSEYARKWVKVVLSGAGGDEVFGGYPRYQFLELMRYYRTIPKLARTVASLYVEGFRGVKPVAALSRKASKFGEIAEEKPLKEYVSLVSYFSDSEKSRLFTPNRNDSGFNTDSNYIQNVFTSAPSNCFPRQMYYVEMKTFLPYNILEYTDRTSMAVSLETRVPFLDHRLVELGGSMPTRFKYSGFSTKILLKKAVADLLPKSVIARRKMAFSPPLSLWLRNELKELSDQYLSEEQVRRRGYFNYSYVKRLIDEHVNADANNEVKLFGLITLELWHQLYLDNHVS